MQLSLPAPGRGLARTSLGTLVLLALAPPAHADDLAELRVQVETLRAEQTRIAELQARNDAALRALELRIASSTRANDARPATSVAAGSAARHAESEGQSSGNAAGDASTPPRWSISGDFRLRGQGDYSDQHAPSRNSAQIRGRVGAGVRLNDRLRVGARLVTGDPDDPNSTDVQLSNWDDDLQVSLDLAYVQVNFDDLAIFGGKFPQPFARTDLVWDGDVNPQGFGATFRRSFSNGSAFRANGALFLIDEQVLGPESTMTGLQLGFDSPAVHGWRLDASAGYYAYRLGSTVGADAGDTRSNLRNPDGSYVSDFDLLDVIVGLRWQGSRAKWPVRLVLDYDRNLGAEPGRDTAYSAELTAGRASEDGDWRIAYGHSKAEVDAVLAAFSHDNIGIATNYTLRALTVDYTPAPRTLISAVWYHYRPEDPSYAAANDALDWLDRYRISFQVAF